MKIVTVIGARPQFIKAAAVSRALSEFTDIEEVIIHTGQHFDSNMSKVFFEELHLPKPNYNLNINSLSHGAMTGRMIESIEDVFIKEKPDYVLVYGDTNSTIAGALAAKKLHIKVAHIEAGLRSFNIKMPEEINRILTDRISDILFCPTDEAVNNLNNEGFKNIDCQIIKNGDVMQDAAIYYKEFARKPNFELPNNFILLTLHRAENTDDLDKLKNIISTLNDIHKKVPIVWLIHPRTKHVIKSESICVNFHVFDPVGYLEMIYLIEHCQLVMTDSGGLQKEAFFFSKNCITLREETEWVELVEGGFNILAGSDNCKINNGLNIMLAKNNDFSVDLYGKGQASKIIAKQLKSQKKTND